MGTRCSDSCQETWELSAAASGLAHPTQELGHWAVPHTRASPFSWETGAPSGRGAGASWRVAMHLQGLKVMQECARPGLRAGSGVRCDLEQVPTSLAIIAVFCDQVSRTCR